VSGTEPLEPRRAFMSMVYLGFRSPWHALRGVREGEFKAISTSPSPAWEEPRSWEMYDLADDPAEKRDVSTADDERLAHLREAIEAWTRRPSSRGQVPNPTDEETQRRLRALGYLD